MCVNPEKLTLCNSRRVWEKNNTQKNRDVWQSCVAFMSPLIRWSVCAMCVRLEIDEYAKKNSFHSISHKWNCVTKVGLFPRIERLVRDGVEHCTNRTIFKHSQNDDIFDNSKKDSSMTFFIFVFIACSSARCCNLSPVLSESHSQWAQFIPPHRETK